MSRLDAKKCAEIEMMKAKMKKESQKTIQSSSPEWDTQGNHYTPAGGGNLIRDSDGAFMQKAAGGYIDTESGEFVPAN